MGISGACFRPQANRGLCLRAQVFSNQFSQLRASRAFLFSPAGIARPLFSHAPRRGRFCLVVFACTRIPPRSKSASYV
jgi:hypothetical protein